MTLTELIEAARGLTPEDRYVLVQELLASVDDAPAGEAQVDAAWQAELRRRLEELESGRVPLVDGRETMRIARERIAERRAKHIA